MVKFSAHPNMSTTTMDTMTAVTGLMSLSRKIGRACAWTVEAMHVAPEMAMMSYPDIALSKEQCQNPR